METMAGQSFDGFFRAFDDLMAPCPGKSFHVVHSAFNCGK
jgi:hypothetical protein